MGLLGGLIGGTIGFICGGPVGAAVGAGLGAAGGELTEDQDDYGYDSSPNDYSDYAEREREAKEAVENAENERIWKSFSAETRKVRKSVAEQVEAYGSLTLKNLRTEFGNLERVPFLSFSAEQLAKGEKERIDKLTAEIAVYDRILLDVLAPLQSYCSGVGSDTLDSEKFAEFKKTLSKSISPTEVDELERLIKETKESKPRIASAGPLKAGKSTMMNCLTGSIDNERFKTGVTRTTVTEQIHSHSGFLFVDTPGIDANEGDDKEAEKALKIADLVLYAHNINGGELDSAEKMFLDGIANNWDSPKEFISKTVFVLTHLDNKNEDSESIVKVVEKQIKTIFGDVTPRIVTISSSRYLKGMRENKTLLVEKSNYSQLHSTYSDMLETAIVTKKERFMKLAGNKVSSLNKVLTKSREKANTKKESIFKAHKSDINKAKEIVLQANETIKINFESCMNRIK